MTNALTVANTVLYRAFGENRDITPMKLQKMVYFVYKKYLKDTGYPLFPERFEAWQYGPVLTSVYEEFKSYASNHIKDYCKSNDGKAWIVDMDESEEIAEAFDFVWAKYSQFDGIYLSGLTHMPETAWDSAVKNDKVFLSDDDIKNEGWFA